MQWWVFGLQEGRDKQFLVKQIESLSQQLQKPKLTAGAQDWTHSLYYPCYYSTHETTWWSMWKDCMHCMYICVKAVSYFYWQDLSSNKITELKMLWFLIDRQRYVF